MNFFSKIFPTLLLTLSLVGCKTTQWGHSTSTHNYVINSQVEEDSSIIRYYLPYKQKMESEMNRVIAFAEDNLYRTRSEAESSAGNFFVDALLEIGKTLDSDVQFSIATKFGIRADIKKGDVTIGNIYEFMPFENYITILEIKGSEMANLLQFMANTGGQPIAGMTMKIKDGKPVDVFIQGQPFDINKNYKLVTYDYLANGGDRILGLDNPISRKDSGILVRNGLIDYLKKLTSEGKTINTKLDGRVQIIK